MKESKFTDTQIMEALKRAEAGLAVPEPCRERGISSATFYKWRAKFGGMDTSVADVAKDRYGSRDFASVQKWRILTPAIA